MSKKIKNRADGWSNVLTGIGTSRDRTTQYRYQRTQISEAEAEQSWQGSFLCAKAIERVPEEATRKGWALNASDRDESIQELTKQVSSQAEDLNLEFIMAEALKYSRAYGGAAVLIGAVDGQELDQPLDADRVSEINALTLFKPSECQPRTWYSDPLAGQFGYPHTYVIRPETFFVDGAGGEYRTELTVHESRLVIFREQTTSRKSLIEAPQGFGSSILERIREACRNFDIGWHNAGILLEDFAQGIIRIEGLAKLMAEEEESVIRSRLETIDMSRSIIRSIVLDTNEDFERKSTNLSGYPEMMDRLAQLVASAIDMPVTVLMGQSPAGLNATGDADIRNFYDRTASYQRNKLLPQLNKIYRLLFRANGTEPDHWGVEFAPLWELDEKQAAEARNLQADADTKYLAHGVLLPEEVAISRFGGGKYSYDTEINHELRLTRPEAAAGEEDLLAVPKAPKTPKQTGDPGDEDLVDPDA